MEPRLAARFDGLRHSAFGQKHYEGVHGLAELLAHRTTFLLVVAPPHVDLGGEIVDDDVRNSDVTPTLLKWFGADHADLPGRARGLGGAGARAGWRKRGSRTPPVSELESPSWCPSLRSEASSPAPSSPDSERRMSGL